MSDRDGHDWLCPYSPIAQSGCKCPWINQARTDERGKVLSEVAHDFHEGQAVAVEQERERIARAIEAYAREMDERWGHVSPVSVVLFNAARIARGGGQW